MRPNAPSRVVAVAAAALLLLPAAALAQAPPQAPPLRSTVVRADSARGTLEVTQEGVVRRAGPGSLIFQASNEMHGLRNVGADTASYVVVRAMPRR